VTAPATTVLSDTGGGTNDITSEGVAVTGTSNTGLIDTEAIKEKVKRVFERIFYAETKQLTLLNICLFLITAFFLKNLFLYLNKQLIFSIQTKATKKLRDNVFRSIIEMHLDYLIISGSAHS